MAIKRQYTDSDGKEMIKDSISEVDNTRYHLPNSKTNHQVPKDLSRILDIMAANIESDTFNSNVIDNSDNPKEQEK